MEIDYYLTPYNININSLAKNRLEWNKYHDQIFKLPTEFRDILSSIKTTEFLNNLLRQKSLNKKQIENLALIIRKLLLAEIYLGKIIEEIGGKLEIDEAKSKEIANLVVHGLFSQILEDLKKMHIEKFAYLKTQDQKSKETVQNQTVKQLKESIKPENTNIEIKGNVISLRQNKD